MSAAVLKATAERIGEHARRHHLREVEVILHGGEPLLAGPVFLGEAATALRGEISAGTAVRLTLQTNGLLLHKEYLEVLLRHDIGIGVSVDGPADIHDRHRHRRDGRGSHADVVHALRLLGERRFRPLFRGLLCTVDLAAEPDRVYAALLRHEPPLIDFLFPHGTWSNPPPGRADDSPETPYADWLTAVFDLWYQQPPVSIRLFDAIIGLLLGSGSISEAVGLAPATAVVVETDGSIEQNDALKAAYEGAAATGLNVADDAFDDVLSHPAVVAAQAGVSALHEDCLGCGVRDVCGGGLHAHRYREGAGFRNPSVYCPDLFALIRHIRRQIASDLSRWRMPA